MKAYIDTYGLTAADDELVPLDGDIVFCKESVIRKTNEQNESVAAKIRRFLPQWIRLFSLFFLINNSF